MDILVHLLDGPVAAEPFQRAADDLAAGNVAAIALPDPEDSSRPAYVDEIEAAPRLVIAGAGHVGQSLAEIAAGLGFEVTIIDDRADCASEQRFPRAKHRIVGEIEAELRRATIDARTYVVIVTRGHRHDGKALSAVLDSPARYVGLIGSKRKVMTIFADLLAQGASIDALCKVHAPVGLEIGAVTVPEIALSIAAELVAVRRGRDDAPASPMKFEPNRLRGLLAKHSSHA
jgi:xanthine dehydrogenase accessory factor